MQEAMLTKKQHAVVITLEGVMLLGIVLTAGIYLPGFWFGVVWITLGLGGWSYSYYILRKAPGWEIIPAAALGGAAMIYYLDQVIKEG
jgi:hypothetical protein